MTDACISNDFVTQYFRILAEAVKEVVIEAVLKPWEDILGGDAWGDSSKAIREIAELVSDD